MQNLECEVYVQYEAVARRRMDKRDADDWPVLAAALVFDCPIWTEDTDFFGYGVATWTTDRSNCIWRMSVPEKSTDWRQCD